MKIKGATPAEPASSLLLTSCGVSEGSLNPEPSEAADLYTRTNTTYFASLHKNSHRACYESPPLFSLALKIRGIGSR